MPYTGPEAEVVPVGSRWLEAATNRVVVILRPWVHDTGPAWRYEDEPGGWNYCDMFDFVVWGRFRRVS